ncbi:MAG: hypothetical protein HYR64_08170, partial [Fimbriimonas ginsengisoli]|nr:hypothetical protein [Fimbriimonas ginsengisoli]
MNIGWFLLLAAIAYPQTIKVDVPLVSVTCSVTDRNGAPLRDLKREDFALLDNGQERDIRYFWQE